MAGLQGSLESWGATCGVIVITQPIDASAALLHWNGLLPKSGGILLLV